MSPDFMPNANPNNANINWNKMNICQRTLISTTVTKIV